MKIWHKLADTDLGPIVFRWRHCNKSRFYNKIFSWILASFMMGMLTSIVFAFLGIYNQALYFSRIVFFITLVVGLINSWFIHAVFGLEFRLTQKAFVAVRPLLGWLPWRKNCAERTNRWAPVLNISVGKRSRKRENRTGTWFSY